MSVPGEKGSGIVVVGSANTDLTVRLERLPGPGKTVLGGEFSTARGGKGANQAVAAARAGGAVTFVGQVGRDAAGDETVAALEADGVRTLHVSRDRARASGTALILVSKTGENSIAVAPGANDGLTPARVRAAAGAFAGARLALLQLEVPLETVEAAAALAGRRGATVVLNPAPARILPESLLRRVAILTPNEHEAAQLAGVPGTGDADMARAAAILLERGVGQAVVITLGKRGALVAVRGERRPWRVAGFPVRAVDTTAAGDTFNGALAVALAEGRDLREAVRFGNAAAAISVTRHGAQPSAPRRREIERFLKAEGRG